VLCYPGVSFDTTLSSQNKSVKHFLHTQKVLEDIKNILFRETYLDVLVDVREIRSQLQIIEDSPLSDVSSVEDLLVSLDKIRRDLGSIPLPTGLHHRRDQVERSAREVKDLLI